MKKSWPILLLFIVVFGIVCVSCYTSPSSDAQEQSSTDGSPIPYVSTNHASNGADKEQASERPPRWRRLFVWPGGVESLGILLTLVFIAWQALLTRQSIDSSEKASQVELRAYIVVAISGGSYQDRENNIKFEGVPALLNTGKTPAHNVRYRNNSAILTPEQAKTFSFPAGDEEIGGYVVGVGQTFTMSIVHKDYCDSQDVTGIMTGEKAALYTWGVVSYDDAFGKPQTTEFCHRLRFYQEKGSDTWKVNGNYVPGRNKAT